MGRGEDSLIPFVDFSEGVLIGFSSGLYKGRFAMFCRKLNSGGNREAIFLFSSVVIIGVFFALFWGGPKYVFGRVFYLIYFLYHGIVLLKQHDPSPGGAEAGASCAGSAGCPHPARAGGADRGGAAHFGA